MDEKYERFEKLCEEKGVTAYKVAKETGITTATLSNWKNGRYTPKHDKMKKIADYFNVPLQYLMTGADPTPGQSLRHGIDVDFVKANTDWHYEDESLKLLFETVKNASPGTLKRLRYYAEGLMAAEKEKQ